jgi:hypothetical protein
MSKNPARPETFELPTLRFEACILPPVCRRSSWPGDDVREGVTLALSRSYFDLSVGPTCRGSTAIDHRNLEEEVAKGLLLAIWCQLWCQPRGLEGAVGVTEVSGISNLLIPLILRRGLIPPFVGSNPANPSQ